MKKVYLFLAEGFEETEAVTALDIMLRAKIDAKTVSVSDRQTVVGAHGIEVVADMLFDGADFSAADALVLPGGMPGADNLNRHVGLKELLVDFNRRGKLIAAICAAPLVPGGLGLLQGKAATVYPGYEPFLKGAVIQETATVIDRNIITARGPAFSVDFGLAIVETLEGKKTAETVAAGMLYRRNY
jgi:4-methyl-5(b-hydroxyethyl)-thiazole monophosphate biosynthesis